MCIIFFSLFTIFAHSSSHFIVEELQRKILEHAGVPAEEVMESAAFKKSR